MGAALMLHVQTRAYPLNHLGLSTSAVDRALVVAGLGEVPLRQGRLWSLAYGVHAAIELDLSTVYPSTAMPDGVALRWARFRVLHGGVGLLSVAMSHAQDLSQVDVVDLVDIDAGVNQHLKGAEVALVDRILSAMVADGFVADARPRLPRTGGTGGTDRMGTDVDAGAVRYNCHFVCEMTPWISHGRISTDPSELAGTQCRLLLPYTYAWDLPVDGPEATDHVLAALEPADVAIGQRAVLAAAQADAHEILEQLSGPTQEEACRPGDLRRHIDRVRLTYQRLDTYRYDSGQRARSVYLAARKEMALTDIHERTESLLGRVTQSLTAQASAQSAAFDARLNRTASVLTVATAGVFVLELVGFTVEGNELPLAWRLAVIALVLLAGAAVIGWLFVQVLRRDVD